MYEGRQQKFNFSHRAVVLTVAASGAASHMTYLKDFSTSAMIPLLEGQPMRSVGGLFNNFEKLSVTFVYIQTQKNRSWVVCSLFQVRDVAGGRGHSYLTGSARRLSEQAATATQPAKSWLYFQPSSARLARKLFQTTQVDLPLNPSRWIILRPPPPTFQRGRESRAEGRVGNPSCDLTSPRKHKHEPTAQMTLPTSVTQRRSDTDQGSPNSSRSGTWQKDTLKS